VPLVNHLGTAGARRAEICEGEAGVVQLMSVVNRGFLVGCESGLGLWSRYEAEGSRTVGTDDVTIEGRSPPFCLRFIWPSLSRRTCMSISYTETWGSSHHGISFEHPAGQDSRLPTRHERVTRDASQHVGAKCSALNHQAFRSNTA
jgi:hypothetical protein